MEDMFVNASRDVIVDISYHPLVLASLVLEPEKLAEEERYVAGALASRLQKGVVCERPKSATTSAAKAMVEYINQVDDEGMDVVLAALHQTSSLISTVFHSSSMTSPLSNDSYKPLLENPSRLRKYLQGDLDEGTPLATELQGIFHTILKFHKALLDECQDVCLPDNALPGAVDGGSMHSRFLVCTDFDDTWTTQDTTEVLVGLGDGLERWQFLMDEVCTSMDTSVFQNENLHQCLQALEVFEKELDQNVVKEALLKGISRDTIEKAAREQVVLRKSCADVLSKFPYLHILSSNWSEDLIRSSLPVEVRDHVVIHTNDLSFDENGICDGGITFKVRDSFDKQRILKRIRSENDELVVIYIGDSINDLLALLEADIGIVIGENAKLLELLSMHHIELQPLQIAAARLLVEPWIRREYWNGKLFQATDWSEVAHLQSIF